MDEKLKKRFVFWEKSAQEEIETAQILLEKNKLRQCLFFLHLSIEKMLKALYVVRKKDNPPRTHNLRFLAEEIDIELSVENKEFLTEATAFNIEARYPDEEGPKPEFKYVKAKVAEAQEVLKWLQKKLQK
jgi:HEPN domain-containing protein